MSSGARRRIPLIIRLAPAAAFALALTDAAYGQAPVVVSPATTVTVNSDPSPGICLSSGQARGEIDKILVPAADQKAYAAGGAVPVACGNLDRQLYRDRVCRAAASDDPLGSFVRYGRTTAELRTLCDAASKVLGPRVYSLPSTRPEGRPQ